MGPDMSHGHGLGYRLVATDHCNMQNRRGTSYAASVVGSIASDEPFLAFVDLGRNWSHAHQLTHRGSLAKCTPSVCCEPAPPQLGDMWSGRLTAAGRIPNPRARQKSLKRTQPYFNVPPFADGRPIVQGSKNRGIWGRG